MQRGLFLFLCLALTAAPAEAQTSKARAAAARGNRLFEQGKYSEAIVAFEEAYDIKPHYLMQCNIARCHEMTGNHAAAARHYRRCLDEGGDRAPIAGEARRALAEAERKAARDRDRGEPPPPPPPSHPTTPASPVDRPFTASLGLGAAMELVDVPSQFKLAPGFAYHFFGTTTGPALGLELQLGFGADLVSLEIGPRFCWDFLLVGRPGLAFYLAPGALLGFAHLGSRCVRPNLCTVARNGLTLQLGVDAKLLLAERWFVSFRPFSLDMVFTANGDMATGLRYDLLVGGGVVF
jgi:hypothetical protein